MTNNKKYRQEYIGRINRVIDYIQNNLDSQLELDTLAKIAYFSKYHFHRIFTAFIGETLNSFIKRLRLEKAATLLMTESNKSITEIALNCGFSGSSTFSRAFSDYFNMSATDYRNGGYINSKIGQIESNTGKPKRKSGKAIVQITNYFDTTTLDQKKGIKMNVEVKMLDNITVAYLRHIGPYAGNSELFGKLFNKLFKWAGPRDLLNFPQTKTISIYYDDPKITDENKLRMDVCLTVPEDTEVSGEIGKMTIAGGKYAVGRFEIKPTEYAEAWNELMGRWLPDSGFVPDDKPCFELYQNDPEQHPQGLCIVDICVPVKPL